MGRALSGPLDAEAEINRRHNEKMARRKAARDRMLATKTEERGLLIIHTGKGKGKSTAALAWCCAVSDTACGSASCNSSRACGVPVSGWHSNGLATS